MAQEPIQEPDEASLVAPSWRPSKLYEFARAALTIGAIIVTVLLAAPFLSSLTWALVLAVMFARPHRAIERAIKRPSIAAGLSVLIVAFIVVAPLLLLSSRLSSEAVVGANFIQQQVSGAQWRAFVNSHAWL